MTQLHGNFTVVLCVNSVLAPVAMEVLVSPASLLQKLEGLMKGAGRWREAGRGGAKKALNRERSGLFLKTRAAESVCFTANVLLFKVLPSSCLFLLPISYLFLSHVGTQVTAALR